MDFIFNGQASGSVASRLLQLNGNVNALRPYIGRDGRAYITINGEDGKPRAVPVQNTDATLRKDDWKRLDEAIIKAAKPRLRVWGDLRAANTYSIPEGMGKTVLESERQSDINEATLSMDGLRKGENDRPLYDLISLPLPIVHKDFSFSLRQILTSRQGGSPLDTTMAELASRRCAETVESLTLGTYGTYAFGGGTIYGYTNTPVRMTKALTLPTASGWTPATLVQEVLEMREQSRGQYHYGPWVLYNSPAWDIYLDDDYSAAKGDNTLRDRLGKIEGISAARTADYLTGYQLLLVQMTSDVARAVVGMDFTTVQWESSGGMEINFKIMGIMVPQLREDHNGNSGIVHGTAA